MSRPPLNKPVGIILRDQWPVTGTPDIWGIVKLYTAPYLNVTLIACEHQLAAMLTMRKSHEWEWWENYIVHEYTIKKWAFLKTEELPLLMGCRYTSPILEGLIGKQNA